MRALRFAVPPEPESVDPHRLAPGLAALAALDDAAAARAAEILLPRLFGPERDPTGYFHYEDDGPPGLVPGVVRALAAPGPHAAPAVPRLAPWSVLGDGDHARVGALELAAELGPWAAPLLPEVGGVLMSQEDGDEPELNIYAVGIIEAVGPPAAALAPRLALHLHDFTWGHEVAGALVSIGPAAVPHVAAVADGSAAAPRPAGWSEDD